MRISDWSSDVCSSDLQRVHRRHLVEELRLHELQAGMEQLSSDHQRHAAADEEHREREEQVQGTEVLVVRSLDPAHDPFVGTVVRVIVMRSEEHTSELQSLMRISYSVFCVNKHNTGREHV